MRVRLPNVKKSRGGKGASKDRIRMDDQLSMRSDGIQRATEVCMELGGLVQMCGRYDSG